METLDREPALVRGCNPLIKQSHVLIPIDYMAKRYILLGSVEGEFKKGQIVLVSGKRGAMKSYGAELIDAEKEDYFDLVEKLSKLLNGTSSGQMYKIIKDSLSTAPAEFQKNLISLLPQPKNPMEENYNPINYLKKR